jgi:periplasmic divalent cation tolerance protein
VTTEALILLSTFPDAETARRIVRTLVEERLAACGNLVPAVESIYTWKGAVETTSEVLAVLKTTATQYPALESRLRSLHPYEVPECIAFPIAKSLPEYLQWITESCHPIPK